jgi:NTE family protein
MEVEMFAVVLGGGGVTGIAWEIGVLAGLAGTGADLSRADAVFGTSAGAFVGAALAGGADLETLYAAQPAEATEERVATVSPELFQAWTTAYAEGAGDPRRVGAGFGAIARRFPVATSAEQRAQVVAARLTGTDWPATLHVTAVDAETGDLRVFDRESGPSLIEAVAASGAVPGISPPVPFAGRQWIDGGMVSSANALVATGFDRVVVIAPLPESYGGIPSVADDVAVLSRSAQVTLVIPDEAARAAIGPNIYDPARRPSAAAAGRRQGAGVKI